MGMSRQQKRNFMNYMVNSYWKCSQTPEWAEKAKASYERISKRKRPK